MDNLLTWAGEGEYAKFAKINHKDNYFVNFSHKYRNWSAGYNICHGWCDFALRFSTKEEAMQYCETHFRNLLAIVRTWERENKEA